MNKWTGKLLALGLGVALLVGMLPAATAASAGDLRQVVANQAKALSQVEWRLPSRLNRTKHSEEKQAAMVAAGVTPTTYFEYKRTHIPLIGAIVENNGASFEKLQTIINPEDKMITGEVSGDLLGMNADAYLVDVVSRVSPTPITGVKQAMTSGALVSLVPDVDLSAASSKAALSGMSQSQMDSYYGGLEQGDILIAWDDNADTAKKPKLHVMVVSEPRNLGDGEITVTYFGYEQVTNHFYCLKCGEKTTLGPTSTVPDQYINQKFYAFHSFKLHKEVFPESSCDGVFASSGATTWHTENVNVSKLLGKDGGVPGGSTHYIPFTVATYAAGNPAQAKVTVEADTSNLAAGFKANIQSDYRIVRVDAVLFQPRKGETVFTNYPEWDDWSCEFSNTDLNRALYESDTGSYTLTLNVHTGPVTDPGKMEVPVVKAYTLDLSLDTPAFGLKTERRTIHQGQTTCVAVEVLDSGLTAADLLVDYDADFYTIDMEASKQNSMAKLIDNGNGSIHVEYFGEARNMGSKIANLYFTAKRFGSAPTYASDAVPDVIISNCKAFGISKPMYSKKAGATTADLTAARVGGDQEALPLGYDVLIHKNYAGGKDLILVFTERIPAKLTYDGQTMVDASWSGYRVNGVAYSHVYAYITENADPDKIGGGLVRSTNGSVRAVELIYSNDVNRNSSVDISDVQCIANIINGALPIDGNMEKWLLADVDRNGKVDTNDMMALFRALKK